MKITIKKKITPEEEQRQALAELQERKKQRDPNFKPKHDLMKPKE